MRRGLLMSVGMMAMKYIVSVSDSTPTSVFCAAAAAAVVTLESPGCRGRRAALARLRTEAATELQPQSARVQRARTSTISTKESWMLTMELMMFSSVSNA